MERLKSLQLEFQNSQLNQMIRRCLFALMVLMQVVVGASMLMNFGRVTLVYNQFLIFMPLIAIGYVILFHDWVARKLQIFLVIFVLLMLINMQAGMQVQGFYLLATMMLVADEVPAWILKILGITFAIGFVVVIGLRLSGLIPTVFNYSDQAEAYYSVYGEHHYWYHSVRSGGESLGFWHAKTTISIALFTILLWLARLTDDVKIKVIAPLSIVFALVSFLTKMYLPLILLGGILVFAIILKLLTKQRVAVFNGLQVTFNVLVPGLVLLSFVLPVIYNYEAGRLLALDNLLDGRLWQVNSLFYFYDITFFGQTVHALITQTFPGGNPYGWALLDNSFLMILLTQGVVFLILTIFALMFVVNKMYKQGYYWMPLVGIVVAIWSFFDHALMRLPFAVFFVLLGTLMINDKNRANQAENLVDNVVKK